MRKLYIIEFNTRGASWYWADTEEEARQGLKEADEATEEELNDAEIWEIDEAVCKHDLITSLNRYIIKPLKK